MIQALPVWLACPDMAWQERRRPKAGKAREEDSARAGPPGHSTKLERFRDLSEDQEGGAAALFMCTYVCTCKYLNLPPLPTSVDINRR